ncbi:hypothetical protein ACN47E_003446 [Coniothyrium glycines]
MFPSSTAGKTTWTLPVISLFLFFLLCSSVGFWYNHFKTASQTRHPSSLAAIFSGDTLDALNRDARLHNALLSFADALAESSTNFGERYRLDGLKELGVGIRKGSQQARTLQELRRNEKNNFFGTVRRSLGTLTGEGTNKVKRLDVAGSLSGILGGLGNTTMGSLGTPALFMGIGLGMGASTGLNLTDAETANLHATKVAASFNASATGANLVAQNLGSGLAGQMMPSFAGFDISLGRAAFAFASGIGNASASGLGLTEEQFLPSPDSRIEAIAGNFGLGVAMPIASKVDIQSMMQSLGAGADSATLMERLTSIASAAGTGLGEGAKNALGLAAVASSTEARREKRQSATNSSTDVNIAGIVEQLTKGLGESFLKGTDMAKLMGGSGTAGLFNIQAMLRPIAAGAGAGLGLGAAVGLNLKSVASVPSIGGNITTEEQQTALVAGGFAQNLVANFLSNSTAIQQAGQFLAANPPAALKTLNPAMAAEGFGRGIIEGVLNAMSSVGGLQNLIIGNVSADAVTNVPVLVPTKFNDSLNGAFVGFARGFMGEGTILVAEIVRNLTTPPQNMSASPQSVPTPAQPSKRGTEYSMLKRMAKPKDLAIRQSSPSAVSPSPSPSASDGVQPFPLAIDATTAQRGAQALIDKLTCQGIGGLASAGLALMGSNKPATGDATAQASVPLDPKVFQSLPSGPIRLSSEGNNFQVIIKNLSLEINGLALQPFLVLTALHVVFTLLAFMILLPLYLIFGVAWRISVLTGHPVDEAKNRKWRMGFLIAFSIFALAGIILGIVGMGSARHFRDTHGIVGLVVSILVLPAIGFSFSRLRTTLPHPASISFTGPKGAITLARTPSRIYLFSGVLIQLVLGLGQFAFIQGFATLRSISLCVVDAVLTSSAIAGLLSFVLMLQIGATVVAGFRAWLEQHIAKRSIAHGEPTVTTISVEARKPSFQSYTFDRKAAPPALNLSRPTLVQRNTDDLKGFEDGAISAPFNARREGSVSSPTGVPANVFSAGFPRHDNSPRTYNPKLGGYQYETDDMNEFFNINVQYEDRCSSMFLAKHESRFQPTAAKF